MNPVVLYMASGESLYAGAALLLAVIVATPWLRGGWWLRVRMLAIWVGAALVVMACPPLPYAFDAAAGVAFVAWMILSSARKSRALRLWRIASACLFAVSLVAAVGWELPRRVMPAIRGSAADHLVILGDSLSAGIAGDDSRWPVLFSRSTGVGTKNLSQPGAQVADALDWTRKLNAADTLVLIEIGGNDLIAGTPTADFDRELDALLKACATPGRTVVMFELPLLPHRIGYGRSQRRLAAKYGVILIPKRYLVQVLASEGATSDGLHLSPAGARQMADLVGRALAPVLARRPANH